jgi:hypothetical protein
MKKLIATLTSAAMLALPLAALPTAAEAATPAKHHVKHRAAKAKKAKAKHHVKHHVKKAKAAKKKKAGK